MEMEQLITNPEMYKIVSPDFLSSVVSYGGWTGFFAFFYTKLEEVFKVQLYRNKLQKVFS
jgi:hypothetical protein